MDNNLINSNWARFSRYEIKDACIMPIKSSRFINESDPWKNYWKTSKTNQNDNIIDELFSILNEAEKSNKIHPFDDKYIKRKFETTPLLENLIINWVNKYGLLGIFHHNIRKITYSPIWYFIEDKLETDPPRKKNHILEPWIISFEYTYGSWIFKKKNCNIKNKDYKKFDLYKKRSLAKKKVSDDYLLGSKNNFFPTALEYDSLSHFNKSVSIELLNDSYWKNFFIDNKTLNDSYLGHPQTKEFLSNYKEPINLFLYYAKIIKKFYQYSKLIEKKYDKNNKKKPPNITKIEENEWSSSPEIFNPTNIIFRFINLRNTNGIGRNKKFQRLFQHESPSLFGILGSIQLFDISLNGREIVNCKNPTCPNDFLRSKIGNKIFCGSRCKKTVNKRKEREAKKKQNI